MRIARALTWLALSCGLGCSDQQPFTEPQVLGQVAIEPSSLNRGRTAYRFYCASCHGADGDGRGPSAGSQLSPPRDFRLATFKFAGDGRLPHDDDLLRIVRRGIGGTRMVRSHLPDGLLRDALHYIKTFSPQGEGFRHPRRKAGAVMTVSDDPWDGDVAGAIQLGDKLYHGAAGCDQCHASYHDAGKREAHLSPKFSDSYSLRSDDDPRCDASEACAQGTRCVLGRCEAPLPLRAPDFAVDGLRVAHDPDGVYRAIAYGLPGTGMPTWREALSEKEIWAMTHYVQSRIGSVGHSD